MKPFSIYFPQFHPTATNDQAWGKGFTDWSLVAHANLHERWNRRAPARGFYDGADPAIHRAQMQEMATAGLGGMALYHYWFYSHQELSAFENTLLAGGCHTQLQWFLVWASEGWSRRWLGDPSSLVSLPKNPSDSEIEAHCNHLRRCFDQPTYLRVRDRPLFVWYHLDHFDRPAEVVGRYREAFVRRGVDPCFGHFVKNPFDIPHCQAVEVSYLFEPRLYFGMRRTGRGTKAKRVLGLLEKVLGTSSVQRLLVLADKVQQKGYTYAADDYLAYLSSGERASLVRSLPGLVQEVVSPGWNNTPRYNDRFTSLQDIPPAQFGETVRAAAMQTVELPVIVNAWNEWSEGAAIEPCAYFGTRYLDALTAASSSSSANTIASAGLLETAPDGTMSLAAHHSAAP